MKLLKLQENIKSCCQQKNKISTSTATQSGDDDLTTSFLASHETTRNTTIPSSLLTFSPPFSPPKNVTFSATSLTSSSTTFSTTFLTSNSTTFSSTPELQLCLHEILSKDSEDFVCKIKTHISGDNKKHFLLNPLF